MINPKTKNMEGEKMNKTITVKGTGNVSAKPDLTLVTMDLRANHYDYETTMNIATEQVNAIKTSLGELGFNKSDIKTTNFDVQPRFESVKDALGNYKRRFEGYECRHDLKIEFDLDMSMLSRVLSALAKCEAKPEFEVKFTIKDKESIKSQLLENAVENAKNNATILAKASGVSLGDILSINYNWGEIHLYSDTNYCLAEECMAAPSCIDIEPEDIDINDGVTIVWEIK